MTQPPYNPNQGQPYPPQQPQQTVHQAPNYGAPSHTVVYNTMPGGGPPQNESNGAAVTSLVLGIIGVVTCGGCSGIFSIVGIICGFVGMGKSSGKSMAVWGLILNFLALLLGIVLFILWFVVGVAAELQNQGAY